jgi:hypothetical protein
MALGSTQPLTEMITRKLGRGKGRSELEGSCEQCNDPLGTLKDGKFLEYLSGC